MKRLKWNKPTPFLLLAFFGIALMILHSMESFMELKTMVVGKSLGGRYDIILKLCGELCDVTKPVEPGPIMGTVSSRVDCQALFHSDELDRPSEEAPKHWTDLPLSIQNEYSHFGKVEIVEKFDDSRKLGSGREEEIVFKKEDVEECIKAYKEGKPMWGYHNSSRMISDAADTIGIEGKTVLVIGTQHPWLEAVLITKNPKQIITLEYGLFKSEYPNFDYMTPKVFREKFMEGTLPAFDAIFTYSSVEHSGLGRYGDALNPWGDIITIARAWCVSSRNAKMAISVPTEETDTIVFNFHRIYGPLLYPYLMTNWKFFWSTQGSREPFPMIKGTIYQPVYVFEKI